jgi:predicted DNA-binding transcriptional regulator YafY
VQPWAITSWHGRWYLVGHDTDRGAVRVFRLSRVEGRVRRTGRPGSFDVPEDLDAKTMVSGMATDIPTRTARVRLRPGTCQGLRLRAGAGGDVDLVDVPFSDTYEVAEAIAWHGPDAVVLEPPDVVDAVVRRLEGALLSHREQPTEAHA